MKTQAKKMGEALQAVAHSVEKSREVDASFVGKKYKKFPDHGNKNGFLFTDGSILLVGGMDKMILPPCDKSTD